MVRRLMLAAVLAVLAPARAQTPDSAEALATPQPGEVAELDLQSIKRFGDKAGRLEVNIVRADRGSAPPGSLGPRRVRYVIDCEEETMTLAAVGVFDTSGQVQRSLVVPPGAVDPVKPAKGSPEQKWLRKACLF
jgi:hypothetical protein